MITIAIPSLEETVSRMKREILQDRDVESTNNKATAPGTLRDAKSFGDLHDYVDANEYGGFCESAFANALIEHFGGRDEHEGMPDAMLEYMNDAQTAIDVWIKSGALA